MALGFDIFRKLDDGSPIWIAETVTLDEARKRLEILVRSRPAEYFVRDARSGEIAARITPGETC